MKCAKCLRGSAILSIMITRMIISSQSGLCEGEKPGSTPEQLAYSRTVCYKGLTHYILFYPFVAEGP